MDLQVYLSVVVTMYPPCKLLLVLALTKAKHSILQTRLREAK
jgi:hypothetical protein